LGVLTKGPLAIVLCVPPLIAIGWLGQNPSRPKVREWLAFGLPVALICIPWYVAVWVANPSFGDYFFWQHNVARFTSGANHQQPWWFYAPILLAGMFPTSLLLPTLIAFLLGRSESKRRLRSADLGFLFCSSLWIIGFFSIASCKLATYILPAMPLICLMLGNMLDLTVFRPELAHRITLYLRPFPRRASMIVLASCGLVAIVDLVLNPEFRLLPALAIGSCAVLAMLIVRLWHHPLMPSGWGWGVTAALGIATVGFTSSQLLGTIAETRSTHSHSARLLRQDPDRAVVYFRESAHAASLYFPKQKVQRFDHTQLADFAAYLDQHPRAIVITSGTGIELTKNAVAAHLDLVPVDARARVYLTNPVKSRARIADRSDLDRHK
jgi:dolichol-phosphate mannosyltransferase